jgi:hypothetical protein
MPVAPSERFRSELDEALAGVAGEEDPIETVGRLGARLILQQALEDEVSGFLSRRRPRELPVGGHLIPHPSGSGSTVRCLCTVDCREDAHQQVCRI